MSLPIYPIEPEKYAGIQKVLYDNLREHPELTGYLLAEGDKLAEAVKGGLATMLPLIMDPNTLPLIIVSALIFRDICIANGGLTPPVVESKFFGLKCLIDAKGLEGAWDALKDQLEEKAAEETVDYWDEHPELHAYFAKSGVFEIMNERVRKIAYPDLGN